MTTAVPLWAVIKDQVAEQRLSYRPADDPIDQISDMYRESMLNDNIIKIIKYNPVTDMTTFAQVFITAQSVAITGLEAVDLLTAVPEALVDPWDNIQDLMDFLFHSDKPTGRLRRNGSRVHHPVFRLHRVVFPIPRKMPWRCGPISRKMPWMP